MLEFLLDLGYVGIFLVNFLMTASVLFPIPGFAINIVAAGFLNPALLILFASFGSALGELVGYIVGYYGNKKILKKNVKRYEKFFKKHYTFLLIVLFAATPLPDDVLGLFCGAISYNPKKFFLASLIGKIILTTGLVYFGLFMYDFVF